jgi:hypothetical protein
MIRLDWLITARRGGVGWAGPQVRHPVIEVTRAQRVDEVG